MRTELTLGVLTAATMVCIALLTGAGCSVAPSHRQAAAPHGVQKPECATRPVDLSYETRVLEISRVFTGADGVSHVETQKQPAQETRYLGALLRQFQLGSPDKIVLVSGPPGFSLAAHPAPYREIFMLLSGSSIAQLSDGSEVALHAGSLVLFEDLTGPGHSARFGPCGYVALDLQFKSAAGALP